MPVPTFRAVLGWDTVLILTSSFWQSQNLRRHHRHYDGLLHQHDNQVRHILAQRHYLISPSHWILVPLLPIRRIEVRRVRRLNRAAKRVNPRRSAQNLTRMNRLPKAATVFPYQPSSAPTVRTNRDAGTKPEIAPVETRDPCTFSNLSTTASMGVIYRARLGGDCTTDRKSRHFTATSDPHRCPQARPLQEIPHPIRPGTG